MPPVLVNASIAGCTAFPALLHDGRVLALSWWTHRISTEFRSIRDVFAGWALSSESLRELCSDTRTLVDIQNRGVPATDMVMHAPANPAQVFCTIGNYRDQILEAARDAEDGPGGPGAPRRVAEATAMIERRVLEGRPYVCSKGHQCVASSGGALEVPGEMRTLDWEVELGVIIGRTAWQIDVGEALDYVAGYCVVNDITLRERIFRNDPKVMGTDWIESKARPGWLPVGPWLVPSWDVHDPQDLRLSLRLNGEVMQNGWTGDMLFGVAEQIAYLAQHTRLEPGDLICTGSPSGFGSHHQRFLQSGDLIEATVEGLGVQRVRCI